MLFKDIGFKTVSTTEITVRSRSSESPRIAET